MAKIEEHVVIIPRWRDRLEPIIADFMRVQKCSRAAALVLLMTDTLSAEDDMAKNFEIRAGALTREAKTAFKERQEYAPDKE